MIVRAYLGEIARGEAGPTAYQEAETEVKDASNKSYRSRKASQHGENKVENQEGER